MEAILNSETKEERLAKQKALEEELDKFDLDITEDDLQSIEW